jgi:hypothetical protein
MGSSEGLNLRRRALDALEKSTQMLEVALTLLKQGNRIESDKVRDYARRQRMISTLLMAEATQLETTNGAHGFGVHLHKPTFAGPQASPMR